MNLRIHSGLQHLFSVHLERESIERWQKVRFRLTVEQPSGDPSFCVQSWLRRHERNVEDIQIKSDHRSSLRLKWTIQLSSSRIHIIHPSRIRSRTSVESAAHRWTDTICVECRHGIERTNRSARWAGLDRQNSSFTKYRQRLGDLARHRFVQGTVITEQSFKIINVYGVGILRLD